MSERLLHSVVVPVFNESAAIDAFHTRCSAALEKLPDDYELVYVDDGSRDDTWAHLSAIAERDSHVNLVRFSRNFGHQIAITAGCDFATGDTVTTIDADLQDPPELIAAMIEKWREGADIVFAVRTDRKGETAAKKLSASIFYRLLRAIADTDLPVDVGDFRLLSRRAVDALQSMPEQHRYVRGMVAWLGFETANVEYVRDERTAGETKYPLRKMMSFATDGVVAFSIRPLRIATMMGLLTSLAAFVYALVLIVGRLTGAIEVVQGWTSLAVLISFLAGVQLITIGALGEYVGRTYNEVRHRPLYLVAETKRAAGAAADDAATARAETRAPADAADRGAPAKARA